MPGAKSWADVGRVAFFVSAGDDGCKNKPVREDDSVGD